jgi:hypothetical protein
VFYNDQRGHQSLNYTTPKHEYEKKQPEIQNRPAWQACTSKQMIASKNPYI